MHRYQLCIVGGGIGGSAAALRAAQHGLRTCSIRGDASTARASRAKYVLNVNNMVGIDAGIIKRKVLQHLQGPQREALERVQLHIGTQDIIDDVTLRLREGFPDCVDFVEERAHAARRDDGGFTVLTDRGRSLASEALLLSTGVMDRQPRVKRTLPGGKVVDEIHWLYPWANAETLLYCVLCEGHLTRGEQVVVFGASEAAAQVAALLYERHGARVALLGNGEPFTAAAETRRLLEAYAVAFHPARVVEVVDGGGKPKGSTLAAVRLEGGELVPARYAMVALGLHRVYNELARQLGAELDARDPPSEGLRHVLVADATSETSVRGLFAVGDMSRRSGEAPSMKQIYTAQEYAVRAVQTVDRRVRARRRREVLGPREPSRPEPLGPEPEGHPAAPGPTVD